jgi:hypothetical protein
LTLLLWRLTLLWFLFAFYGVYLDFLFETCCYSSRLFRSDTCCLLMHISRFYLTIVLALYLTFCPTACLISDIPSGIWHSLWHILWHILTFHLTF